MARARRVMGIAVSSGKIGFAYLVDGELMDWKLSIEASRTAAAASDQAEQWLKFYHPDQVVLENPAETRKGAHSKELQMAIAASATTRTIEVTFITPSREWPNKYEEAAYLAEEFPQLAAWLPDKRRLWETEPRNIVLFEALSLASAWWRSHLPPVEEIDF